MFDMEQFRLSFLYVIDRKFGVARVFLYDGNLPSFSVSSVAVSFKVTFWDGECFAFQLGDWLAGEEGD